MENVGDDLGKQFERLAARAKTVLRKLPLIAGNRGKNFFQDRFRDQAWYDQTFSPWKKRKETAERNKGRAILTDSGTLKRSISVLQADWDNVIVGIPSSSPAAKYAAAHNWGFTGTVSVHPYIRIASRKVGTKALKLKGRQMRVRIGGKKIKIQGASHGVKMHSRKMNIPQRQFIGNSALLNRLLQRDFVTQLKTI